jgi:hypothetical protein
MGDKGLLCVVTVINHLHQGLVLRLGCVPGTVGINQNDIAVRKKQMQLNQPRATNQK